MRGFRLKYRSISSVLTPDFRILGDSVLLHGVYDLGVRVPLRTRSRTSAGCPGPGVRAPRGRLAGLEVVERVLDVPQGVDAVHAPTRVGGCNTARLSARSPPRRQPLDAAPAIRFALGCGPAVGGPDIDNHWGHPLPSMCIPVVVDDSVDR